jgi:hypothetical protein
LFRRVAAASVREGSFSVVLASASLLFALGKIEVIISLFSCSRCG